MTNPREGSRKAAVFSVWAKSGGDAAKRKAKALGLSEATARSWVYVWERVSKAEAEARNAKRRAARRRAGKIADLGPVVVLA